MDKKYIKIIIAMCGLVSSSVGVLINSTGVFYHPVAVDLQMNQGTFSMYETISIFTFAALSIVTSKMFNNKNFKKYIIIGTLLSSISTMAMSLFSEAWQFYILGFIAGLGKAIFYNIIVNVIINNWIITNHGFVTGLVLGFSGIAGALFSSFFTEVIKIMGWRYAYVVMGAIVIVLNLPAILWKFSLSPSDEGEKPYLKEGEEKENKVENKRTINCTPFLFILMIIMCFITTGLTGFPQNLSSYVQSLEYPVEMAGIVASLAQIGNVSSKVILGIMSDHIGPIKSIYVMLIATIAAVFMLKMTGFIYIIYVGAIVYGAIYSVSAVAPTLLIKEKFGLEQYRDIFPYTSFAGNTGVALSVSMFGYLYEYFGSYDMAFVIIIVGVVIIAACVTIIEFNYKKGDGKHETKLSISK